jgi:hypothetical protein
MFASRELRKERLAICKECEHRAKTTIVGYTCGEFMMPTKKTCGCILKSLVSIDFVKCKSKKW